MRTFCILCLTVLLPALSSAEETHRSSSRPASTELDRAFQEFAAAAQHLGKSVAKAADNSTAETREKLLHTVSGAMLELGKSMNETAARLSPTPRNSPGPSPTPPRR